MVARSPGRLGEQSTASPAAWRAAGAAVRVLHETPLPGWASRRGTQRGSALDEECAWLLANDVVPPEVLDANRELALVALRERRKVFVHGDLQVAHGFVRDDEVTGILDWSEAGRGDPMYDLASLTLGHPGHLAEVMAGYGDGVDLGRAGVVVAPEPHRDPMVARARLRPSSPGL
jgi:aminoglycoside phosphotransferase (APT) family kinase protein